LADIIRIVTVRQRLLDGFWVAEKTISRFAGNGSFSIDLARPRSAHRPPRKLPADQGDGDLIGPSPQSREGLPSCILPALGSHTARIYTDGMDDDLKSRWYRLTPDPVVSRLLVVNGRFVLGLLVLECLLWLSERFQWFGFNSHKGWTVLIAVASVGVAILLIVACFAVALVFRWRFQFSIRSLLVLTIAVAVPFSWLAAEMKKAREQKEGVEEIGNVGGSVEYDWQVDASGNSLRNARPSGPEWLRKLLGSDFVAAVVQANLFNTQITDGGLAHIAGFSQLQVLCLGGTKITDAGLAHIEGLNQLQSLWLNNTKVTDAGLAQLIGLPQLQDLNLRNTQITDAGLAHIAGLTQLQHLDLFNTQITDAGLARIAGLTQLQHLDLSDTQITNAGLECLNEIKQLRVLDVSRTQVTNEGVKKLQQALPNCKIER
jgi:hypothetical protein